MQTCTPGHNDAGPCPEHDEGCCGVMFRRSFPCGVRGTVAHRLALVASTARSRPSLRRYPLWAGTSDPCRQCTRWVPLHHSFSIAASAVRACTDVCMLPHVGGATPGVFQETPACRCPRPPASGSPNKRWWRGREENRGGSGTVGGGRSRLDTGGGVIGGRRYSPSAPRSARARKAGLRGNGDIVV